MKTLVYTQDLELVFIAAFRYALGRCTYMPKAVTNCIKNNISLFSKNDFNIMIKEITEAEQGMYGSSLGDSHNKQIWLDFRDFLITQAEKEQWVKVK